MGGRGVTRVVFFALSVAALALALAACGRSAPDEFEGTWRQLDYETAWSAPLVIVKTDAGYRATLVFSEAQPQFDLSRTGGRLTGTTEIGTGTVPVEIVYDLQSGHITVSVATKPGGAVANPTEFTRTSTSTVIETPSPF